MNVAFTSTKHIYAAIFKQNKVVYAEMSLPNPTQPNPNQTKPNQNLCFL